MHKLAQLDLPRHSPLFSNALQFGDVVGKQPRVNINQLVRIGLLTNGSVH